MDQETVGMIARNRFAKLLQLHCNVTAHPTAAWTMDWA
jgi:hypothetical protein